METSPKPSRSRRAFLRDTAKIALPAVALNTKAASAQTPELSAPARIVRESAPENLEFPFSSLETPITPTARFYVRNHFPIPPISPSTHKLRIEGAVGRALELSLDELRAMPSRTQTVTLECAGNGRVFLTPSAPGVAWSAGAVSTAVWKGVPLAAVLERAGLRADAVEIVLEGADKGAIKNDPKPPGEIAFARSLPRATALSGDVLLAYEMNGQPLPARHGGPLRAVVPNWYAVASVKWLTRIVAATEPFAGYYQTIDYAFWSRTDAGIPVRVPITKLSVKSSIARPVAGETLPPRAEVRVFGAAWSATEIVRVEVSADGGKTFSDARLLGNSMPGAWRLWEYLWRTPSQTGPVTLISRATDAAGRVQPSTRNPDLANYQIHHTLPIPVEIGPITKSGPL